MIQKAIEMLGELTATILILMFCASIIAISALVAGSLIFGAQLVWSAIF